MSFLSGLCFWPAMPWAGLGIDYPPPEEALLFFLPFLGLGGVLNRRFIKRKSWITWLEMKSRSQTRHTWQR
jgi:hypothetical protein